VVGVGETQFRVTFSDFVLTKLENVLKTHFQTDQWPSSSTAHESEHCYVKLLRRWRNACGLQEWRIVFFRSKKDHTSSRRVLPPIITTAKRWRSVPDPKARGRTWRSTL